MKVKLTILFHVIWLSSFAQITINSSMMPLANDTFRLSVATNAQQYDFSLTGSNYSWDFSNLTAIDQRLEDYVSISATPLVYNVVFLYPLVATVAAKRADAQMGMVAISNGYNFYKTTTSKFAEVGFGADFQGTPIPVKYQEDDIIFHLPLSYNAKDSSTAIWSVSIPNLGSIYETKKRVNHVDGYGSVTTPYGTFQCLRVKSEVRQRDSVVYSASPIPLPAFEQEYTEYLWLTNDHRFPVLKATERNLAFQVEFMDSIKSFAGMDEMVKQDRFEVYPNPTQNFIEIKSNVKNQDYSIELLDFEGKIILEENTVGVQKIDLSHLPSGKYILKLTTDNQIFTKTILKTN